MSPMSLPRKIRAAQVGVRGHGRTIIDAAQRCGGIDLIAVCDADEAAARETGARLGIPARPFTDLLRESSLDAVLLVTPNPAHLEQTLAVLDAGIHVFVEKPMARDVAECAAIAQRARERGRIVQVGHNARFSETAYLLQTIIEQGQIGTPVSFEAQFSHDAALHNRTPAWKLDPETCPLLPMTQLGIHLIDTMRMLCGEVESVMCMPAARLLHDAARRPVVDVVAAILRFRSGVVGSIQSSYITPDVFSFRICGHTGHLTGTPEHVELVARTGNARRSQRYQVAEPFAGSFRDELLAFVKSILLGTPVAVNAVEGLLNVAVVDAMRRSAAERCEVRVADVVGEWAALLADESMLREVRG